MTELICAPITPFRQDGELDEPGTRVLFEAIRASGIEAVFAPGTTGEFTALTDAERMAVIRCALEVFGPDGVYAHVGAATTRQAVPLARAAHDLGATRLAAITPYYTTAGPVALAEYYRALAAAVPRAEFYVYVFPARATTTVSPAELAALATIPGVAGAKISGLSTEQVAEYIRAVPAGFRVFAGNDIDLVRLAAVGGAGVVSGVSGVFPAPFVAATAALDSEQDASPFQPAIDRAVEAAGGGDIRLLKVGVATRGLPAGPARVSLDPPTDAQLALLRQALAG